MEPRFVISVWNCRAAVSRRIDYDNGWAYEPAVNWQELEELAIEAIEEQGGAINMSALYLCPSRLAERGRWLSE